MLFPWLNRLCRRDVAARRLKPRACLSIERLEDRVTPTLQLTYGGPGTILRLMETSAGNDAVAVSEAVAGTLHIDLGTASFAPNSSTQGVTYSTPGLPGESHSADVSIAAAGAIRSLLIDLGGGTDTLALGMTNAANAVGGIQVSHSGFSGYAAVTLNSLSLTGDLDVSGGPIRVTPGATVATNGGNLTLTAHQVPSIPGVGAAVAIDGATLDSGVNGNIDITGEWLQSPNGPANGPVGAFGIDVRNGARVQAEGSGTITFNAQGASGLDNTVGVMIFGPGTAVTTAGGDISISGDGGVSIGDANDGIDVLAGATVAAGGSGDVTLAGLATSVGADQNLGIFIDGAGTTVSTAGGNLLIIGTSASKGSQNFGIDIEGGASVRTAGAGFLSLQGHAQGDTPGIHFNGFHHGSGTLQSGSGTVSLFGDVIDLGAPNSLTSTGHSFLTIAPTTSDRPIDLGNSVDQPGALTITPADLAAITQQGSNAFLSMEIGSNLDTGRISTFADLTFGIDVTLESSGANSQGVNITNSISVGPGRFLSLIGGPVVVSGASTRLQTGNNTLFVFGVGTPGVNGGIGVDINGATLDSGNGNLTVTGTGASGTSAAYGVHVHNAARLQTEGSGVVTLNGTGGLGTDFGIGARIADAGTVVTTAGGPLSITGNGQGSGVNNHGIVVALGAQVHAGLSGALTLHGVGGNGMDLNMGVRITESGTAVTTENGNLAITGNGQGSGANNHGILVAAGAVVQAGGSGTLTLNGTGGNGTFNNIGVWLTDANTAARTAGGNLLILGSGRGSGTGSHGIAVVRGAKVSAGGSGSITLQGQAPGDTAGITFLFPGSGSGLLQSGSGTVALVGDVIDLGGPNSLTSTGGSFLVLETLTRSRPIDLGNTTDQPGALTFTPADNVAITQEGPNAFGVVEINTGTGRISTFADLTFKTNINLVSADANSQGLSISHSIDVGTGHFLNLLGGPVVVSGASTKLLAPGGLFVFGVGTPGVNGGIGVDINGATLDSGNGNLTVTGTGAVQTSEAIGVVVQNAARIQADGSGAVTLTGTGGDRIDFNPGVYISDSGTRVTTTAGSLTITGTGKGSGNANPGITVGGGAVVHTGSGTLTLNGTGSNGTSFNYGVYVVGGRVETESGNLSITGNGQGHGDHNKGLELVLGAVVQAGGNGTLTLNGTGGNGTDANMGVYIADAGTVVTTAGAPVSITGIGQGSGANNNGTVVANGAQVRVGGSGTLRLEGTGGNGTTGNLGIALTDPNTVVMTVGGNITLVGTGQGSGVQNIGIFVVRAAQVSAGGSVTAQGQAPGDTPAITFTGLPQLGYGFLQSGGNVTLIGDVIDLGNPGTITTTGHGVLYFQPLTPNRAIDLGNGSDQPGALTFTHIDNAAIAQGGTNGFSSIVIGRADGTGKVSTFGNLNFNTSVGILSFGANSQGLSITNSIDVGAGHALFLFGGPVVVSGASTQLLTHGGFLWVYGVGTAGVNSGIGAEINGATLDSGVNGTLFVTGTGAAGTSNAYGILAHGAAKLQAEGSGTVTLNGTGGNGTFNNIGVYLQDANTAVTTAGGALSITGVGQGSGGQNYGILVLLSASISAGPPTDSLSGAVTLQGQAPGDTPAINFTYPSFGSGQLHSSGGPVSLIGDVIDLGATGSITGAPTATLSFQPRSVDRSILLGNRTDAPGVLTFTPTDAAAIAQGPNGFGEIDVGRRDGTGAIRTAGALSINSNLGLFLADNSAGITISNSITVGTPGNGRFLSIGTGPVLVTGASTQLKANGGGISIRGVGVAGINSGIGLIIDGAILDSGTNGSIGLRGIGAAGLSNAYGVAIRNGAQVLSGGNGPLTIVGLGGEGTNSNIGLFMDGRNTTVATEGNGTIILGGSGGGSGDNNSGIVILSGLVQASGTGTLTLIGRGSANGRNGNVGISLASDVSGATTTVQTLGGNLTLQGIGRGSGFGNDGIDVQAGAVARAGGKAGVILNGTGTTTGGSGYGVHIFSGGQIVAGNKAASSYGLVLNSSSSIIANLSPTNTTGFGYTFIQVDGMVDLGGASLQLAPTGTIIPGMTFNLVVSPKHIKGKFAQGSVITTTDGAIYDISYLDGSVILRRR